MKISVRKPLLFCSFFLIAAIFASAQNIEPKQNPKDSKWGFVEKSTDKWIVKPKYDNVEPISKQPNGKLRGKIVSNGKTGFIDEFGNILGAGVVFEEIEPIDTEAMIVTVKGKKGIVNYDGTYLIKPELTSVEPFGNEGFFIAKNDKRGFIKRDGSIVLDLIYNKINTDVDGYFILDKGGKAALALRDGSILIEPKDFTAIEPFGEYWLVSKKDNKGLYDLNKKALLIEPNYNDISQPFELKGDKYFKVRKKDKWGVCDSAGNLVIKCKSNRLIIVPSVNAIYANSGWVNGEGLYIMPSKEFVAATIEEKKVGPFDLTKIGTSKGSYNLITNSDGKTFKTDGNINKFGEFYLVGNGKDIYSIFSKDGEPIVSNVHGKPTVRNEWIILNVLKDATETQEFALSPEGGLSQCKIIGDLMFILNEYNNLWICFDIPSDLNFYFEEMEQLSGNKDLVNVKSKGLWGLLSKDGYVINPVSDEPLVTLDDSVFVYCNSGKKGLVSTQKGEIIKPKYDEFKIFRSYDDIKHIRVNEGEYRGIYDLKNDKWIVPVSDKNDRIEYLSDGYIACKGKGKGQLYDINGKKVTRSQKFTLDSMEIMFGYLHVHMSYEYCNSPEYVFSIDIYKNGKYVRSLSSEKTFRPDELKGNIYFTYSSQLYGLANGNYIAKVSAKDASGKNVPISKNNGLPIIVR